MRGETRRLNRFSHRPRYGTGTVPLAPWSLIITVGPAGNAGIGQGIEDALCAGRFDLVDRSGQRTQRPTKPGGSSASHGAASPASPTWSKPSDAPPHGINLRLTNAHCAVDGYSPLQIHEGCRLSTAHSSSDRILAAISTAAALTCSAFSVPAGASPSPDQ